MTTQPTKHTEGGTVVIAAILGETKILLIKEITKPIPHFWKLVSETVEPRESILAALCRGVEEEAGLKLETRQANGTVVEIIDPRIRSAKQLAPSHMVQGKYPHRRHFWGLLTTDDVVMSLSGKHLTGDVNEEIDTMAFDLFELEVMVDLLPQHREIISRIPNGVFA